MPFAATIPNSARWPRKALTVRVRCRIQKLPHLQFHACRLLPDGLDPGETHYGARDRLADRFCVSGVGLAPFDVWLDVSRRHEPYLMSERGKFTRPVMGPAASFHANQQRRQFREEAERFRPS